VKKITRSGLKSVVKECLIEILSEGLSDSQTSTLKESRSRGRGKYSQTKSASKPAPRRTGLDNVSFGTPSPEKRESIERIDKRISETVSNITSDNVLSSILEDTARTTLQQQMTAESSKRMSPTQGDHASRAMAESDPLDIFEGSSNWADLAFAAPISKNRL
jgi:hypothetical protein